MKPLIHHLLGETRTAILAALLLRPERTLHVRELVRMTGASPGTLHRELKSLVEYGVLLRRDVGRQVFYQANPDSAVLPDLTGLIRKTAGLVDVLRARERGRSDPGHARCPWVGEDDNEAWAMRGPEGARPYSACW